MWFVYLCAVVCIGAVAASVHAYRTHGKYIPRADEWKTGLAVYAFAIGGIAWIGIAVSHMHADSCARLFAFSRTHAESLAVQLRGCELRKTSHTSP